MKLSLSAKIPLRVSLLILLVGTLVTLSLLLRAYEVFKDDLLLSSENMGRILSRSLSTAMLQDDTWKAYEIINTPFSIETREGSLQPDHVVVLDSNYQVYISTSPTEYPMLSDLSKADPELSAMVPEIPKKGFAQFAHENSAFGKLYVVTPVESDNVLLGAVVISYSDDLFRGRFVDFSVRALATLFSIVLLSLPLAIYWGRRMARPLISLSERMAEVSNHSREELKYPIPRTGDEVEQLGHSFAAMLEELHEKDLIEQQMVSTQRLAALGRFTAGIAHEINNPLGGMLNALSTLHRHGRLDHRTEKTLDLLKRGLLQIKGTVGAILVEASPEDHPLSGLDIDDTRALVARDASARNVRIALDNKLTGQLPLPSTLVRQVVINLLINAIEASPDNGRIDCDVGVGDADLIIMVRNAGEEISDVALSQLFEPFSSDKTGGRGLGLWVTYQIVDKLNGNISVSTGPDCTEFMVRIPVPVEEDG